MANLVIIRGLPGSGKSTMAKQLYPDYVLCEADQYFEQDGEYKFDAKKLPMAHEWCYNKVLMALSSGKDAVVANTFTRLWEFERYLNMNCASSVTVVTATGSYDNVHGVPVSAIERMRDRWEEF